MELVRRLSGPFKEFGLRVGALYVADRMLRALSPRLGLYAHELMVQPIAAEPLLRANLVKNYAFSEIDRNHPDVERMPAQPEIKAARFEQGARCLGAYRKGALVGYIWFCQHRYVEDEVRCVYDLVPDDQSVFDFDLYLFPEHRMGIAFTALWHGANEYLRERGIRYTYSRVTRFNLASRRSHARLGWRRVGRALFLQAWRLEVMAATLAPYVAVTWGPGSTVHLRLSPEVLTANAPGGEADAADASPD